MSRPLNFNSLSIIVPAFNEEKNLAKTVEGLIPVIGQEFSDFEILIYNDKSADRTGEIAEELRAKYPHLVKVVHNEVNRGLGYNYKSGIQLASKELYIMCPGDNENTPESLLEICRHRQEAQIIIPYPENSHVRPFSRQLISKAYVSLMNLITGSKLRYYNGTILHRTELIKPLQIESEGFGYQSEILAKLLAGGASFKEVPFQLGVSGRTRSAAFRLKNIISVARTIGLIFIATRKISRANGVEAKNI